MEKNNVLTNAAFFVMQRKVHAHKVCDDFSVRAQGINNLWQQVFANGADEPKSIDMVLGIKCHRDELFRNEQVERGKPRE